MAFVGRSDVKDPGAQQEQWLYAEDEQFRSTRPDDEIAAAARSPGLRIAEVMATVLQGYAGRPALAQRAREVITDAETGRSMLQFLPRFETITYPEDAVRVVGGNIKKFLGISA